MKKYLIVLFLILGSFSAHSQRKQEKTKNLPAYDFKRIHFGFSIALNVMDFGIVKVEDFFNTTNLDEIYSIENEQQMGFSLGPIVNFHMGEYFDFRTLITLSFGQRNLQYRVADNRNADNAVLKLHTMKLSSTYMEFPLLLKYKAKRHVNLRPYLIIGANPKIDLAARKKIKDSEMPKIRLNNFDISGELGGGLDFYLTYFKFSIEIKYSIGARNMLIYDDTQYTKSIDRMTSNVWMLSFHFE